MASPINVPEGFEIDPMSPHLQLPEGFELDVPIEKPSGMETKQTLESRGTPRQIGEDSGITPPVDWAKVGRDQIAHIPDYAQAAMTAGVMALAPATEGLSLLGLPFVSTGARYAGQNVSSALQNLLGIKDTSEGPIGTAVTGLTQGALDTMGASPNLLSGVTSAGSDLVNAGKWAARTAGNAGQIPQRVIASRVGLPKYAPEVETLLKHRINYTNGEAVPQIQQLQKDFMEPMNQLVADAKASGNTIKTEDLTKQAQDLIDSRYYNGDTKGANKIIETANELLEGLPSEIDPERALSIKQDLYKKANSYDINPMKEEAGSQVSATRKAIARDTRNAIGESTSDPSKFHDMNKQYGILEDAKAPANKLDTSRKFFSNSTARAAKPIVRGLYKLQELGAKNEPSLKYSNLSEMLDSSGALPPRGSLRAPTKGEISHPELPSPQGEMNFAENPAKIQPDNNIVPNPSASEQVLHTPPTIHQTTSGVGLTPEDMDTLLKFGQKEPQFLQELLDQMPKDKTPKGTKP